VKNFLIIMTIGLMALGSGMMLAAHFTMPGTRSESPQPTAVASSAHSSPTTSFVPSMPDVTMPKIGMPDVRASDMRMPSMPDVGSMRVPDAKDAAVGAGRAFGKATDTMAYYSDQAFGGVAAKAKRSVDEARVPELP